MTVKLETWAGRSIKFTGDLNSMWRLYHIMCQAEWYCETEPCYAESARWLSEARSVIMKAIRAKEQSDEQKILKK